MLAMLEGASYMPAYLNLQSGTPGHSVDRIGRCERVWNRRQWQTVPRG
jgi:hypothetical protein